ncbi:MAG: dynamin family protein [Candidatus Cloacimonetes bacterium]|nr:dynamin family protein [Candidatus Cloacimonadota bacterium]
MSKNREISTKVDLYQQKLKSYGEYKDLIGNETFTKLEELVKDFRRNAENALDENRLMRIGIIGQINRGKSSFLNALFFDGEDVLPKAATPMTAALTKINYSEKPKAVVEFYTENEWLDIRRKANEANEILRKNELIEESKRANKNKLFSRESNQEMIVELSADQKSCLELVTMVTKSNLNIEQFLGKTIEISNSTSTSELVVKLGNYVGSHGTYAPLVKSSLLSLDIESLKNTEIVDTPGMNDPIVSRARKTEEFMGQCDVIFLLSSCSQFLDITDMRLLAQNLPSKGIRKIILIGSLFDSVLLDVFESYDSIGEAISSLIEKKQEEARSNFSIARKHTQNSPLLDALDSAFPPIFVSSMCYNIAKHYKTLNAEERQVLGNLNAMYTDFKFTEESLNSLANFEEIKGKFEEIKSEKDQILSRRFSDIMIGFGEGFKNEVNLVKRSLIKKRNSLEEGDIESLSLKQKEIVRKLESGTIKINNVFENHIIAAEKNFSEIILEIEESASSAKSLNSRTGTETHSYQVSNSRWWNPFSWGSTRTEYQTITYTYAHVHEAVEKLEEYVISGKKTLIKAVKEIVNISKFRRDVAEAIKGLFDFSDDNFDPDDILIPVENAINRITIPAVEIDVDKHIDKIRDQFKSSEVRNDEIESLRREQARIVKMITKDLQREIEETLKKASLKLSEIKMNFVPSLTNDLNVMVSEIAEQIKHRKEYLVRYNEIIEKL